MRSPPLIVWRTCHQTETHSARRSLHKYWHTQKKRESTLFLGWLIPAGRRKSSSNFERMLPTTRETDVVCVLAEPFCVILLFFYAAKRKGRGLPAPR